MYRIPTYLLAYLVLSVMLFSGCGKKAPPFPPRKMDFRVKVDQLEGAWEDNAVILKGVVQGEEGLSPLITGCRVYYVWYSLDRPPCEGCPIEMAKFRAVTGNVTDDHQFKCRMTAFKQKGICFIMVRISGKEGVLGPASDRIKLISEN